TESIYCVQAGTPKIITPASLAAYANVVAGTIYAADPGINANISLTGNGCSLLISAAGSTGLPVPTQLGQQFTLTVGSVSGGYSRKVAIGAGYGGTPTTTIDGMNKFATFSGFGQFLTLVAIP